MGNLTYRKAARNFIPLMCMAAADAPSSRRRKSCRRARSIPSRSSPPASSSNRVVEVADPQQEEDLIRAGVAYVT